MELRLTESERRLAEIVWDSEPIASPLLVKICENKLNWKKSTTYTILKKLCDHGICKNENTVVSSLINREEARKVESRQFVERNFDGSIPQFLTAFFGGKKLSSKETEELQKLIDSSKED